MASSQSATVSSSSRRKPSTDDWLVFVVKAIDALTDNRRQPLTYKAEDEAKMAVFEGLIEKEWFDSHKWPDFSPFVSGFMETIYLRMDLVQDVTNAMIGTNKILITNPSRPSDIVSASSKGKRPISGKDGPDKRMCRREPSNNGVPTLDNESASTSTSSCGTGSPERPLWDRTADIVREIKSMITHGAIKAEDLRNISFDVYVEVMFQAMKAVMESESGSAIVFDGDTSKISRAMKDLRTPDAVRGVQPATNAAKDRDTAHILSSPIWYTSESPEP